MIEHNLRLAIKRGRGDFGSPVPAASVDGFTIPKTFNDLDSNLPCSDAFFNHIKKKGFECRRSYTSNLVQDISKKHKIESTFDLLCEVQDVLEPPDGVEPTRASCGDTTVIVAHVLSNTPYMPFAERLIASFLSDFRTVSYANGDGCWSSRGLSLQNNGIISLQNDLVHIVGTIPIKLAIQSADSELAESYKEWGVADAKGLLTLMFDQAFPAWRKTNVAGGGGISTDGDTIVGVRRTLVDGTLADAKDADSIRVEGVDTSTVNDKPPMPDIRKVIPRLPNLLRDQYSHLRSTCIEQGLPPAARWAVLLSYVNLTLIRYKLDPVFQTMLLEDDYGALLQRLDAVVDEECKVRISLRVQAIQIIKECLQEESETVCGNVTGGLPDDGTYSETVLKQKTVVDRSFYIPYFLSIDRVFILRPRRFGKSLWLSVLHRFFSDPRSLDGLIIRKIEFSLDNLVYSPHDRMSHRFPPRPVLLFDFSQGSESVPTCYNCETLIGYLELVMTNVLKTPENQDRYAFKWRGTEANWSARLVNLIQGLHLSQKEQIVVLVDEYDAPLLNCHDVGERQEMQSIMIAFFSTLKSLSAHILLTVVTGISRWDLATMFSGGNDLVDLTFDSNLACLFGFTDSEVSFILENNGFIDPADVEAIKKKCNGYSFDCSGAGRTVCNPFYISQVIKNPLSDDFWLNAGPSLAMQYVSAFGWVSLPTVVTMRELESGTPQVDTPSSMAACLVHAGYATIKKVKVAGEGWGQERSLTLDTPNDGMKASLARLAQLGFAYRHRFLCDKAAECMLATPPRWGLLGSLLNTFFLAFRLETRLNQDRTEGWNHELLQAFFMMARALGTYSQISNALGRADLTIVTRESVQEMFPLEPDIGVGILKRLPLDANNEEHSVVDLVSPEMTSNRVVLELKRSKVDTALSKAISSRRLHDSITGAACEGMAQVRMRCYLSDSSLVSNDAGQEYKRYAATVVCDSDNSLVHCIMLQDGTELRYSKFAERTRTCEFTERPPPNAFYMQSFLWQVGYESRKKTPLGKLVYAAVEAHGINALSLMSLAQDHVEFLLDTVAYPEHIEVLEAAKTARPTPESIVVSRKMSSASAPIDFCNLLSAFIWFPEDLEFAKQAIVAPSFEPSELPSSRQPSASPVTQSSLGARPSKRKPRARGPEAHDANQTAEQETGRPPRLGTILAVVSVRQLMAHCLTVAPPPRI